LPPPSAAAGRHSALTLDPCARNLGERIGLEIEPPAQGVEARVAGLIEQLGDLGTDGIEIVRRDQLATYKLDRAGCERGLFVIFFFLAGREPMNEHVKPQMCKSINVQVSRDRKKNNTKSAQAIRTRIMKSKFLPHAPVPLDELARRHFDPREIDADLGRNVDQVRPAAERKHCVANLALKPRGGQVLPRAKKKMISSLLSLKNQQSASDKRGGNRVQNGPEEGYVFENCSRMRKKQNQKKTNKKQKKSDFPSKPNTRHHGP
jgi:hypothetical protein